MKSQHRQTLVSHQGLGHIQESSIVKNEFTVHPTPPRPKTSNEDQCEKVLYRVKVDLGPKKMIKRKFRACF